MFRTHTLPYCWPASLWSTESFAGRMENMIVKGKNNTRRCWNIFRIHIYTWLANCIWKQYFFTWFPMAYNMQCPHGHQGCKALSHQQLDGHEAAMPSCHLAITVLKPVQASGARGGRQLTKTKNTSVKTCILSLQPCLTLVHCTVPQAILHHNWGNCTQGVSIFWEGTSSLIPLLN